MQKLKWLIALVALALCVPAVLASTAGAAADTPYHYTDQKTGICTNVTFPQSNWFNTTVGPPNNASEAYALGIIAKHNGFFGVGWVATGQVDIIPAGTPEYANLYVGGPSQNPWTGPVGPSGGPYVAVATYQLAIGSCPVITPVMVQTDNINGCASTPVWRADGTQGIFVTVDEGYLQTMNYAGVSFTPAYFVEGVGATCDIPPGYHFAGYNVDGQDYSNTSEIAGHANADNDDNIYPYYVRASVAVPA